MARSMARITPGHVRDLAERTDPDARITLGRKTRAAVLDAIVGAL
jgi:hypothetical protein